MVIDWGGNSVSVVCVVFGDDMMVLLLLEVVL